MLNKNFDEGMWISDMKTPNMHRLSHSRIFLIAILVGLILIVVGFVRLLGGVDVDANGVVVVDSSRLHLDNTEFAVSNEVAFSITVRGNDACETIYFDQYTDDVIILVGGRRLIITQESIIMYGSNGVEGTRIPALEPIQLRIWQKRMTIAGSWTWAKGMIEIEHVFDKTEVTCSSSAPFRATVISNWYYF